MLVTVTRLSTSVLSSPSLLARCSNLIILRKELLQISVTCCPLLNSLFLFPFPSRVCDSEKKEDILYHDDWLLLALAHC